MPTLGDLDGDGDLDLLVGEASGWLNDYGNDGSRAAPAFALGERRVGPAIRIGRSAPHRADLDGDGNLDLLVGAEQGALALFQNRGTRQAARFVRDATVVLEVPRWQRPPRGTSTETATWISWWEASEAATFTAVPCESRVRRPHGPCRSAPWLPGR